MIINPLESLHYETTEQNNRFFKYIIDDCTSTIKNIQILFDMLKQPLGRTSIFVFNSALK